MLALILFFAYVDMFCSTFQGASLQYTQERSEYVDNVVLICSSDLKARQEKMNTYHGFVQWWGDLLVMVAHWKTVLLCSFGSKHKTHWTISIVLHEVDYMSWMLTFWQKVESFKHRWWENFWTSYKQFHALLSVLRELYKRDPEILGSNEACDTQVVEQYFENLTNSFTFVIKSTFVEHSFGLRTFLWYFSGYRFWACNYIRPCAFFLCFSSPARVAFRWNPKKKKRKTDVKIKLKVVDSASRSATGRKICMFHLPQRLTGRLHCYCEEEGEKLSPFA